MAGALKQGRHPGQAWGLGLLLLAASACLFGGAVVDPPLPKMEGRIQLVDNGARSFTVQHGHDVTTFWWDASTRFLVAGHPVKPSALFHNSRVVVEFAVREGHRRALRVTIYPVKTAPAK